MRKILLLVMTLFIAVPSMDAKGDKEEDFKEVLVKNPTTGNWEYEAVVNVENVSKEEMFKRAKKWIVMHTKTGNDGTQADSSDLTIAHTGSFILKPISGFGWNISNGFVNFKLNIAFRDGRYKFTFDNVAIQCIYSDGSMVTVSLDQVKKGNKAGKQLRKDINDNLLAMSTGIEDAVKGNSSEKDKW